MRRSAERASPSPSPRTGSGDSSRSTSSRSRPAGPLEIVAWRIVLSLVFCALLIAVTRAWRPFAVLLRDRRVVLTMGVAGVLIFVNWQTYVYATLTGQVVEAALGYFINPIVTVFLGVLVLRERLNATQWVAVGISIVAVIVLAVRLRPAAVDRARARLLLRLLRPHQEAGRPEGRRRVRPDARDRVAHAARDRAARLRRHDHRAHDGHREPVAHHPAPHGRRHHGGAAAALRVRRRGACRSSTWASSSTSPRSSSSSSAW